VFDKTGTLGDGKPRLERVEACHGIAEADALRIAAALERDSSHPLAAAFADIVDAPAADGVRAVAGRGVEGLVAGRRWRIGTAAFATGGEDDGAVWLGARDDGGAARARFVFAERERADAAGAVRQLRAQGLALHLSSGDADAPVQRFAHSMGIEAAHARQSPEGKLALVRGLQRDGKVVAMVGDGLNDAPVLAGADVSLAIGDGAALAQRAADLVLSGSSLGAVPAAIAIARRTRRIVRQNLAWAFGYNLLALPLAAAGMVTPWLAALGMALSSLAVTANSLRLAKPAPRERMPR
jgi:Cu2+-exporting ATPase